MGTHPQAAGAAEFLFPSTVRNQVLEQHQELRRLLGHTLEQTSRCLLRHGPDLGDLTAAARELRRRMFAHLAFEERALAPILAAMDLWGPERVQALLDEHRRQRAELDTVIDGIETDWDAERAALVIRSLTIDLLRDMEEEEKGCLSAALLLEEVLHLEKTAG
jgi:hypothetical protein